MINEFGISPFEFEGKLDGQIIEPDVFFNFPGLNF